MPIDFSRGYLPEAPQVDLVEVGGGHALDSAEALSAVWGAVEAALLGKKQGPEALPLKSRNGFLE